VALAMALIVVLVGAVPALLRPYLLGRVLAKLR
jgi:hypothetical protein